MPATTTTNLKIPYPLPGDRLADYPATAKNAAETIEAAIPPRIFGDARITTPPAGAVLRVLAWTARVELNQYGQAVLVLPEGVSGIVHCVVCSARFDTEWSDAFGHSVAVTGVSAGRPVVTVTKAGNRVPNATTTVSVIAVGW